jgi:endo-1,4-beta-D-glucanase Y
MLIAEVAGQPERVRTIWSWTNADLGRPDGLFASHASGAGEIEDPQSATDVDILIAYALLRFAGPDQAALHRAGRRVAEAVLALESVTLPDGSLLPVARPWARSSSPPTVDPSYLMPGVFVALARFTGDDRWNGAAGASIALIDNLTDGGRRLPPIGRSSQTAGFWRSPIPGAERVCSTDSTPPDSRSGSRPPVAGARTASRPAGGATFSPQTDGPESKH